MAATHFFAVHAENRLPLLMAFSFPRQRIEPLHRGGALLCKNSGAARGAASIPRRHIRERLLNSSRIVLPMPAAARAGPDLGWEVDCTLGMVPPRLIWIWCAQRFSAGGTTVYIHDDLVGPEFELCNLDGCLRC